MKTLLIALLSTALLFGCGETKIIYKDRIVHVPEIVMEECPQPPVVEPLTTTPLDQLTADSKNTDVARAYVKTVELCENKNKQYKEALDAVTDESEETIQ